MIKHTKIVATLGPASQSQEILEEMIVNGMNVARFNFSHGEDAWHEEVMRNVREAAKGQETNIAILADLQGPHIRTVCPEPLEIVAGETIALTDVAQHIEKIPAQKIITIDCPHMIDHLRIDHNVFIEDGLMQIIVREHCAEYVLCEIINGGIVKDHKGVNIPDAEIPLPTLTRRDKKNLTFILGQDVDYVALSFVRSAQDVTEARALMTKMVGGAQPPKIVVKIERKEAIKNLDVIITATDAVMVARGDLGIETPPAGVTVLQKNIIHKSLQQQKPVIVATQMLQSMVENPRPTRAEVADVTNAVIDHADAVMLSAETTVGKYPRETVKIMNDIALQTERSPYDDVVSHVDHADRGAALAAVRSVVDLATESNAKAVVVFSHTGGTAQMLSHFRLEKRLFVVTDDKKVYNQMALLWGIEAHYDEESDRGKAVEKYIVHLQGNKTLHADDQVVVLHGADKDNDDVVCVGSRIIK